MSPNINPIYPGLLMLAKPKHFEPRPKYTVGDLLVGITFVCQSLTPAAEQNREASSHYPNSS